MKPVTLGLQTSRSLSLWQAEIYDSEGQGRVQKERASGTWRAQSRLSCQRGFFPLRPPDGVTAPGAGAGAGDVSRTAPPDLGMR